MEHDNGKVWFGVWMKDQPPRDYPIHPSDYTSSMPRQMPTPKDKITRLHCLSPFCSKISSISCPRQFCASDCHRAPGGPCTAHVAKPTKSKITASSSQSIACPVLMTSWIKPSARRLQRTQVRKEKKAREERNATMGSGRRSAFLSMPPSPCSSVYLTATTANGDDSSSDIEVSEIENLHAPMKRA